MRQGLLLLATLSLCNKAHIDRAALGTLLLTLGSCVPVLLHQILQPLQLLLPACSMGSSSCTMGSGSCSTGSSCFQLSLAAQHAVLDAGAGAPSQGPACRARPPELQNNKSEPSSPSGIVHCQALCPVPASCTTTEHSCSRSAPLNDPSTWLGSGDPGWPHAAQRSTARSFLRGNPSLSLSQAFDPPCRGLEVLGGSHSSSCQRCSPLNHH